MTRARTGLGVDFDVLSVIVPIDLADGANSGHRIHLQNYGAVTFCGYVGAGSAGEAVNFNVQQHDAASSGNSKDLDAIDTYYQKEEATLDGDETWVKVTQTAGEHVTDADWDDANQVLVAFTVRAEDLDVDNGYEWVSVDVADTGTAHIGCVFAVASDLKVQRAPENLPNPNA